MNIFFLDFETTGLSPYLNDIIEVAVKKHGCEHHYQAFVKPKKMPKGSLFTYVPPYIVNLTGITDKIIHEKGIEKSISVYNLCRYIENNSDEGEQIYIVAHNGNSFDFIFFRKLVNEYIQNKGMGINMDLFNSIKYIDTLLMAKCFPEHKRFSQNIICEKYGIVNESEHRALGDVKALEELYCALCKDYAKYKGKEENYFLENPNEIQLFI